MNWPEDDYMELGERGLIAYDDGFIEKSTGRYIDAEDLVYDDYNEPTNEFQDEEYDRDNDDEDFAR